ICQLPNAFAASFTTITLARVVLGAAEGPASPLCVHALYKWFDDKSRTLPAGFTNSIGAAMGMLVAAPLLTWISHAYGWRAPFIFLAVVGAVWVVAWLVLGEDGPIRDEVEAGVPAGRPRRGYAATLLSWSYAGICLCGFAAYWANALLVIWVPTFLVEAHGYAQANAAWVVSLISLATGIGSLASSALSQLAVRRGASSRHARALPLAACTFLGGVALWAASQAEGPLLLAALVAGFGAMAAVFPLAFVMVGELSPVATRGSALAICSAISTSAGVIAPLTMGFAVQRAVSPAQGFEHGFMIAATLGLCCAALGAFLIRPDRDGFARRSAAPDPSPRSQPPTVAVE
ncbi:MAG: MFS transporter, partial [Phenylobacterium sp.]